MGKGGEGGSTSPARTRGFSANKKHSIGNLRYAADLRTFGFAFLWFASCIWQWRTRDCKEEFQSLAGFGYALVCYCITTLQAFQGGVSVHNAAHCPPFYNEQGLANRLFYLMLTIWNGAPVTAYVPGHNLSHHKYLQTRRDIMRTNKVNFGSQALNIIAFFPSILGSIQSNDFKYMQAQRRKGCAARPPDRPLPPRRGRRRARPPRPRMPLTAAPRFCSRIIWDWYVQEQILFHAVLIALLIADWRKALLIYFLPCGLAKDMLVSLNILQHDGCDAKSKYNHSRNFTSDALNYLLFNNGYHTIHHMKPGVHWSLTKKQHDELVAPYIHPNLLKPSIVGYAIDAHFMGKPRVNYDGTAYTAPGLNAEAGDDEDWFYEQASINATSSNSDVGSKEDQKEALVKDGKRPLKAA